MIIIKILLVLYVLIGILYCLMANLIFIKESRKKILDKLDIASEMSEEDEVLDKFNEANYYFNIFDNLKMIFLWPMYWYIAYVYYKKNNKSA